MKSPMSLSFKLKHVDFLAVIGQLMFDRLSIPKQFRTELVALVLKETNNLALRKK